MTETHFELRLVEIKDVLVEIRTLMVEQIALAKIADFRGRTIAEMWEKQEKLNPKREVSPQVLQENRSYDWWRLENGAYAKVYRTILKGGIYQEDGVLLQEASWNPLSLHNLNDNEGFDLVKRKEGFDPKGWPTWTK